MLEAIVFDFDGIVVDSEPLHYKAFLLIAEPLGISFSYQQYKQEYIGFDDRDGFRAMFAQHGLPLDDQRLAQLIADKAEAFEQIVGNITPFPGVRALIEAAAAAVPTAICSGAMRSDIDAILPAVLGEHHADRFKTIVTADDVTRSKPDPESYALAASRLGINPARAIAIEDTPAGLASAKAAGFRTLAVTNTYPEAHLEEADHVVESLEQVDLEMLRNQFRIPS
ncbi:MAG: HAD family phosphatase [Phycisphaeraceae bacterium]